MTRADFMRRLGELLQDLPAKEREDALRYYGDYFNDAGEGNDDEIIKSLGSPESVAEMIKNEAADPIGTIKRLENEVIPVADKDSPENTDFNKEGTFQAGQNMNAADARNYSGGQISADKKRMPTWAVVLITIACVILSPAILGLAITAIAVAFSLIVAVFTVAISLIITFLVLAFVAAILLCAGGSMLFARPLAGLTLIGGACVIAAVCLFALVLGVLMFGKVIPALFKWISSLNQKRRAKKNGGVQG